jgi:uncharacterized repeat protein (TIGR03803 family)
LYGTAYQGGLYNDGTIFRITPQGALTTLHNFAGSDGAGPGGGLVQAADGDLYGTTAHGGAFGNWGTIFKITPAGALTTLHSFDGADGGGPQAPLIQASDGDLHGTTYQGGASDDGTIFKITPAGALTVLHSFDWTDGAVLTAGLVQATNGDFYGTTNRGATNDSGTVFKITPAGALTTLHIFSGSDGAYPDGGLIQATNGNLYGTTVGGGGASNCTCGTIFEISPAGLTTLQSFDGSGGVFPYARLVQDTNGKLYGTTQAGETQATLDGTVFSLSLGLAPFVKTLPTVGPVGSAVKILGSDLTGATSVTFNGVPAAFTVVSVREISTAVPTGATTGKVEVVTSSGTLVSSVGFAVP